MSSFIDNFQAQCRIAGKKFAATLFNDDEGLTPSAIRLLRKENVIEEHPDGWKIYLSFKPSFLPSIRFGSIDPEVM